MRRSNLMFAVALTCATAIVGCKKEDEMTPAPPAPSTTPPAPSAAAAKDDVNTAGGAMRDAAANTGAAMKDAAGNAVDATKDAANAAHDKLSNMAGNAKDTMTPANPPASTVPPAMTTPMAGTATATEAQATTLMDQAATYIKENKWELADSTMVKLDGMQAQMPEALKPRYAQLKTMYDQAKAGKALKMPGM